MSGVLFVIGHCVSCRRPFTFHPDRVPSVRVTWKDGRPVAALDGEREPVCADCFDRLNAVRRAHGMAPVPLLPGAYDVADEGEW